jgi:hypothetical protein
MGDDNLSVCGVLTMKYLCAFKKCQFILFIFLLLIMINVEGRLSIRNEGKHKVLQSQSKQMVDSLYIDIMNYTYNLSWVV